MCGGAPRRARAMPRATPSRVGRALAGLISHACRAVIDAGRRWAALVAHWWPTYAAVGAQYGATVRALDAAQLAAARGLVPRAISWRRPPPYVHRPTYLWNIVAMAEFYF
ncbi:hypothetical protein F511_46985 [Dorcoceras hygrometricum]|uniref:Uncharacterized protein n=1 Tax=Dorcoceras hygrometricum TaxID=472368 RepID=A0A2Z6ZZG8_9LAMI|nr:hypothetical protein F511_46985 [Dorcoceras hygrometricum]